uniref:Uncharacterized protein n=1 Tax=Wuchereria bancrofti TaxID=6293 RepID=A0AAF5Q5U7_WUCBA
MKKRFDEKCCFIRMTQLEKKSKLGTETLLLQGPASVEAERERERNEEKE